MLSAGDSIENPVTGETFTWIRTGRETGGSVAEVMMDLAPTAFLAARHIHRVQEERFDVVEGRVRLHAGREQTIKGPGESVIVPAGMAHSWGPEGGAARVKVTLTPGNEIEDFFERFFELANEGRCNKKGMPPLRLMGPLALRHELYLAGPPIPLQRAVLGMLTRLVASSQR